MFRCPTYDCRQKKEFIIPSTEEVLTLIDGEYYISPQGSSSDSVKANKEYLDEIIKDGEKVRCAECKVVYSAHTLVDAYNKPMAVFGTTNLCDCGGEIWEDFEVVENEQSSGEWSGDQRKASSPVVSGLKCEKCHKTFAK